MAERKPKLARRRSIELAKQIDAQIGECYANAMVALQTVPELSGAWYVEGVAILSWPRGMPVEHAWLETLDGVILDPTLALRDPTFPTVLRWPISYRAVARYTCEEAYAIAHHTWGWTRWLDDPESTRAM